MVQRNILIAYILAFSKNTWFWLGIWIFYYLQFTTYVGIGLIETTLIITYTLAEIPTGAVADLLGKKKTLILAFLFETIGALIMAMAMNFEMLVLSVFVMCVGGAFYSGTIDALLFDTLKQDGKEKTYDSKISMVNTIGLIAPAICGLIGGFLYTINPRLPFFGNAIGYSVGLIACLFLVEPVIDSVKFSFRNFLVQTKQGLRELFKSSEVTRQTILLFSVGCIVVICSEMLDSFLGFEFGFSPTQFGILWSVIFLISAIASQSTPLIRKHFNDSSAVVVVGAIIACTLLISPILGMAVGGIFLTMRAALESVFGNLTSVLVNNSTESTYRATTISTFNMIKNIPYVVFAYVIGSLSDSISARQTALVLGIILLVLLGVQMLSMRSKNAKHSITD
jgi:MFS family permease